MPDRELTPGADPSQAGAGHSPPPAELEKGATSAPAASPRYCPSCGQEYDAGLNFCPRDGTVLQVRQGGHDLVGQMLGQHYRILELLGEGGMGQVFLAEHVRIGRRCAIKVMRPALVKDPGAVGRFGREATTAGRINHRHAVAVHDFGETPDGLIYIVMEYVEGVPLTQLLAREGALPPVRALEITLQLTEALAAAHRLGIIHRDLKPDNILVSRDEDGLDLVKVVDFGIAKALNDGETALTRTGFVVGTLQYMSPEQLTGEPLDARSDLYSVGCVLYEMLTGERTFAGPSGPAAAAQRLMEAPPSPRSRNASIAAELDALVRRALARAPAERFQSAEEMRAALKQLLGHGPTGETATQAQTRGAMLAAPTPQATALSATGALGSAPDPAPSADALDASTREEVLSGAPAAASGGRSARATPGGAAAAAGAATTSEAPALARGAPKRLVAAAVLVLTLAAGGYAAVHRWGRGSAAGASGMSAAAAPPADVPRGPVAAAPAISPGPAPAPSSGAHDARSGGPGASPSPAVASVARTPPARAPERAGLASSGTRPGGSARTPARAAQTAIMEVDGSLPPGATILVDGLAVPGTRAVVAPGEHTLSVVAPGRQPFQWSGALAAGDRRIWSVVLQPSGYMAALPAPGPGAGPPAGSGARPPVSSSPAEAGPPVHGTSGAPATDPTVAAHPFVARAARNAASALVAALEARDPDALQRAWPGIAPANLQRWQTFLASPAISDLRAQLVSLGPLQVRPASASAQFALQLEFVNRARGRISNRHDFVATFRRQDGRGFTLVSVRGLR